MTIEDGFERWWNTLTPVFGSDHRRVPDGPYFSPKEARMVWDFAVGSLITDGDENPNWPDCHQVQCAQLHETLDSLLDMLGCKCSKRVYAVGKMVHICEALRAKDAEIERLLRVIYPLRK